MIGYVGNESDCTHGVAVALDDENGKAKMELSAATTACAGKDAVPDGTWRLPSRKDWQYLSSDAAAAGHTPTLPAVRSIAVVFSRRWTPPEAS